MSYESDEYIVSLPLVYIQERISWIDFCEHTGINEWAKNEGIATDKTEFQYPIKVWKEMGVLS